MKRIVVLLLLATSLMYGQERRMERGRHPEGMMDHQALVEKLDLTTEQRGKIERLRADMQKNAIMTRSKVQMARVDLRELYREENPDRLQIESKITEIGKLQTDMKLAHAGFWFDVNKVL